MPRVIKVKYENDVPKLLEPLELREGEGAVVRIEEIM